MFMALNMDYHESGVNTRGFLFSKELPCGFLIAKEEGAVWKILCKIKGQIKYEYLDRKNIAS